MKIIKALLKDVTEINALTLKSKAHWGYSKEQIEAWTEELSIDEDYIKQHEVFVLKDNTKITGFYAFIFREGRIIELDFLFVDVDCIGKGYGKLLMQHFKEKAFSYNPKYVLLKADPNAEVFYKKHGFITKEKLESDIKNRFIPLMELAL